MSLTLAAVAAAVSLLCSEAVLGEELRIKNATEFLTFSQNVNKGNMYKRTTVFLDADLDFTGLSQSFEPIGRDSDNNFRGHFDGQGHLIKNLAIKTTALNVGLFGYSEGTVIKNVVIDKSCSIVGTHTSKSYLESIYIGSVMGYCHSTYWFCNFENNINLANVIYSGDASKGLNTYLGGITGSIFTYLYNSSVRNCVNYGLVAHSGSNGHSTYIGGISGELHSTRFPLFAIFVRNCLNYGTVSHVGPTQKLVQMGGIAATISSSYVENSVNAGKVASGAQSTRIGALVGFFYTSFLTNCYWSESITYKYYGETDHSTAEECTTFSSDFKLSKAVSVKGATKSTLLDALNTYPKYSEKNFLSNWILNRKGSVVSFSVNGQKRLSVSSEIILLPNLADDGQKKFDGWYTDIACKYPLRSSEVGADTGLYSKFA